MITDIKVKKSDDDFFTVETTSEFYIDGEPIIPITATYELPLSSFGLVEELIKYHPNLGTKSLFDSLCKSRTASIDLE